MNLEPLDREPDLREIRRTGEMIGPFIHRTPVLTSRSLNEICGTELFFKCENFQKAGAESALAETGGTLLHPYDDFAIIAGQGTAALELCEDHPELDVVVAPVGGGGLLSGTLIASKGLLPAAEVLASEPADADDAWQSLRAGRLIPQAGTRTVADGLRTSLGRRNWPIIQRLVDDIVTVSEESIVAAMRLIWERMKIVVEPSSAVVLATVQASPARFTGKRVGLIISGGNVDLGDLPW